MNDKMIIPKTISVGFQERKDTYTGQLAYVVYTDDKGVLRKEKSWNCWRDKSIETKTFDNIPTSGFVLNKKVGETRYGWNPRMAWIRIYDPRGFEFEISVNNLLFILEECTSTKGKGIEGEFVYSWDGKDLVLLPVCSKEYITSTEFTNLKVKTVSKKDIHDGWTYKLKDLRNAIYIGFEDWFKLNSSHSTIYNDSYENIIKNINCGKEHVFYDIEKNEFFFTKLNKIASIESTECCSNYADLFESFKNSKNGTIISDFEFEKYVPQHKEEEMNRICLEYWLKTFVKIDNKYYFCILQNNYHDDKTYLCYSDEEPTLIDGKITIKDATIPRRRSNSFSYMFEKTYNFEETFKNCVEFKSVDDYEFYLMNVKIGNTFLKI